jgi:predicted ATPase/DNA-binding winged helix-turn-helix (wHTH) protein
VVLVSFADFELDTAMFELRCGGRPVPVEPQVFDVLAYLVRHRDRVVTKTELLDEIWGDRFVSESTLTSRIKNVRQVLDDDGRRQRWIKTVHGRGYRFTADATPVTESDGRADAGPPRDAPVPHNLPTDRTPLFGRTAEVPAVAALLDEHRLVTLLGIGGTGKTRLAAAVGQRLLDRFDGGVWFVDLVPAGDTRSVELAIARAVGLALAAGDVRDQLAGMLGERDVLLVLDNAEHVLDELVPVLDHLLEHTTRPRFLVTSRLPLDLPEERRVPVAPLDCADPAAPAVQLLLTAAERFGAVVADAELDTAQRICQHLDGLPLAIELAAAQLRVLGVEQLMERLDQRFELLHERRRPGRERHASLTSVLTGTWSLLEPDEREVLARLAAFPGPFGVVDAEQLCADLPAGPPAGVLSRLVDRSLVDGPADGRFRLLETVRLFARQHSDAPAQADRHAQWCLRRVGTDMAVHAFDLELAEWCTRHHDDVSAAERHLIAAGRPAEAAMLLAGTGLAMHCDAGAHAAGALDRVDGLLALVDDPAVAVRLHVTAVLAGMPARAPAAIAEHGRRAVAAAEATGDPRSLSIALVLSSWSVVFRDPERAVALTERAAALAAACGAEAERDYADGYRALHLATARRPAEAVAQAQAVVDRGPVELFGGRLVAVIALAALCAVHEPKRALPHLIDLLTLPSPETAMWSNQLLAAAVLASAGRSVAAVGLTTQIRERLAKAGRDGLPDLLVPAAVLAHRLGDDRRAARWLRAVRAHHRTTHSFHITCVYRGLRDVLGADVTNAEGTPLSAAEADAEAIAWMRAVARQG